MLFSRSGTPSPGITWSESPQVQYLLPTQTSQPSPSSYVMMTDVSPSSRPPISLFTARKPDSTSPRSKTASLFSPIKFFPRPSPTSPASPATATPTHPSGRGSLTESHPSFTRNQTDYATCFSSAWVDVSQESSSTASSQGPDDRYYSGADSSTGGFCSPSEISFQRVIPQDQRVFRSPKHWFMPGKFFAYAGAQ
jgi:hypothetical protein